MNPMQQSPLIEKPSLLELRGQYDGLTLQAVAEAARLPERDVYAVEIGGRVSHQVATAVLNAFSRKTGGMYTLENVKVNVIAATIPEARQ